MKDAYYIDTRENAVGVFACPIEVSDYKTWITDRYKESSGRIPYGIAQKVNQIINAAKKGDAEVLALGPYSGVAAKFIEDISKNTVIVEVI